MLCRNPRDALSALCALTFRDPHLRYTGLTLVSMHMCPPRWYHSKLSVANKLYLFVSRGLICIQFVEWHLVPQTPTENFPLLDYLITTRWKHFPSVPSCRIPSVLTAVSIKKQVHHSVYSRYCKCQKEFPGSNDCFRCVATLLLPRFSITINSGLSKTYVIQLYNHPYLTLARHYLQRFSRILPERAPLIWYQMLINRE